ncbi:MAG: hypothetical protein JSU58_03540 [Dehalococcoidales bacterium]|nr:MAG: hypothetical protein JSU58_03540 [Dehalococcoidales bacterium]
MKIQIIKLGQKNPGTRKSRIITSIISILWCIGTLIFFNLFRDYMAYFHDGIRDPFITSEFVKWLWIHNPLLILTLVSHSVFLIYDRYVLREGILVFLALLGVASTAVLLSLFPFDFSVFPGDSVSKWAELGLRIALIITIVSMSFDFLISGNTLIRNIARGNKDY